MTQNIKTIRKACARTRQTIYSYTVRNFEKWKLSAAWQSELALLEERESRYGDGHQLDAVGDGRRLQFRVRPAFPAHDVARQPSKFRRVAALDVLGGQHQRRHRLRDDHTAARAFQHLNSTCHTQLHTQRRRHQRTPKARRTVYPEMFDPTRHPYTLLNDPARPSSYENVHLPEVRSFAYFARQITKVSLNMKVSESNHVTDVSRIFTHVYYRHFTLLHL